MQEGINSQWEKPFSQLLQCRMDDGRDSEVVSFILKTSVLCAECEYSNPVTCKES